MITVILSWTILFVVFLSFGEIAVQVWNTLTKHKDSYSVTNKFWIGICFLGTILLYVSIFSPLDIWVLIITLITSSAYWIVNRAKLKVHWNNLRGSISQKGSTEKAMFIFTFVAVLIYSLSTPLIYDEGLYHLQTMQWSEKYNTILGLGNLHGRLGFNSSFLLLSTLFNYHPAYTEPFFTINSLSLLVFSFWIINLINKSSNILSSSAIALVLITSLFTLGTNISSTSTDILANIFIMYLLISWALEEDFLVKKPLLLILIVAFSVTLKLSSAIILLSVLVCTISLYSRKEKRIALFTLAVGLMIAAPWISRFIMMTGYLVYPFPSIDLFSVDWKIPLEMVIFEKDSAYAWARIPWLETSEVLAMSFSEWFHIWIKNLSVYKLAFYIVALSSPIILVFYQKIKQKDKLTPWLIAYSGVIFGLLTAPDFRFGFGFIVCAIVIPLLILTHEKGSRLTPRLKVVYNFSLLILTAGIMYIAYAQVNTYQYLSSNSKLSLILKPQSIKLLQSENKAIFEEYKLKNTTIFIPLETDQCFDQSIPCMPYHSSNIEMRGQRIQDGFRIKRTKH